MQGARLPLTMLPCGLEYSVHDLLIVPTCQHSDLDLVRMGEEVEKEKDYLLEKFTLFAAKVCQILEGQGHWGDYVDPCSGLTMRTRFNGSPYSEVDAFSTLLGYKTANAGCCKVLLHPTWGTRVYPASLFARAPVRDLQAAIEAANVFVIQHKLFS